jgi:hypothetical protein
MGKLRKLVTGRGPHIVNPSVRLEYPYIALKSRMLFYILHIISHFGLVLTVLGL